MIWSRVLEDDQDAAYYKTCYGPFGYVRLYGDRYFVRQPTENHPEYIYVSSHLPSAGRRRVTMPG